MGPAMFTIIGAMAELESSLISERVTAGMKGAAARGKHLGRPPIQRHIVAEIKALARSTDLSVRKIHEQVAGKASRSVVGEITKQVRSGEVIAASPASKFRTTMTAMTTGDARTLPSCSVRSDGVFPLVALMKRRLTITLSAVGTAAPPPRTA